MSKSQSDILEDRQSARQTDRMTERQTAWQNSRAAKEPALVGHPGLFISRPGMLPDMTQKKVVKNGSNGYEVYNLN